MQEAQLPLANAAPKGQPLVQRLGGATGMLAGDFDYIRPIICNKVKGGENGPGAFPLCIEAGLE